MHGMFYLLHTFLNLPPPLPPIIFSCFTLPLEIPDKTKLHPWKFCKIVLHHWEIPRPKTKTPGNSTWFFLGHPWKFHFVFNYNLWKFHVLFLWHLWKFHILNPLPLFVCFFWYSPILLPCLGRCLLGKLQKRYAWLFLLYLLPRLCSGTFGSSSSKCS